MTAMLSGSQRISGTATDGLYRDLMTVPAHAEQGTWTVDSVLLVDQVGNVRTLNTADLQAAAFPVSLNNG